MAYNYRSIKEFLNKVDKEAAEAAQAVYDKYEAEFLERVQNQIKDGDTVYHGMGACTIINLATGDNRGENLSDLLGQYQYHKVDNVGMSLPHKFDKTQVFKH